jgi:hypothetical protein
MATRKQRAANRRNAKLSTGPKTPEGKAAVRLNALKHGLTTENTVIFTGDEEAFNNLRDSLLDHLQPADPLETALAHQIVMAQWRLTRCRKLETGLFELSFVDHEQDFDEKYTGLNLNEQMAYLYRKSTDTLATLSRYEARIERSFFRALHELQRLQAARQPSDPPPPPAKTVFTEPTQIAPKPAPKPITPNDFAAPPSPTPSVSPSPCPEPSPPSNPEASC